MITPALSAATGTAPSYRSPGDAPARAKRAVLALAGCPAPAGNRIGASAQSNAPSCDLVIVSPVG